MDVAWQAVIGILTSVLVLWIILLAFLFIQRRKVTGALRLVPNCIALLKRLATDSAVPTWTRIAIFALVVYLLSPIDLVPDFFPGIGYLDDAIIVVIAIRLIARRTEVEIVERNWTGTTEDLDAILAFAGLKRK